MVDRLTELWSLPGLSGVIPRRVTLTSSMVAVLEERGDTADGGLFIIGCSIKRWLFQTIQQRFVMMGYPPVSI
jgi:hypothetical protein